jgi:hypothetical protein
MIENVTHKSIPLKDGTEIPAGTEVRWMREIAILTVGKREVKIPAATAAKAMGIAFPTIEQLEYWVSDGSCESILGENVEPDGIDEHGSPSWLLAFGLI